MCESVCVSLCVITAWGVCVCVCVCEAGGVRVKRVSSNVCVKQVSSNDGVCVCVFEADVQ